MSANSSERPDLAEIGRWQLACRYQLDHKQPKLALLLAEDLVCYAERTCQTSHHWSLAVAYRLHAEAQLALGNHADAKKRLEEARGVLRTASKQRRIGEEIPILEMLAQVYTLDGEYEVALAMLKEVENLQKEFLERNHPDRRRTDEEQRRLRICSALKARHLDNAEVRANGLVEDCKRTCSPDDALSLAAAYLLQARIAEARGCPDEKEQFATAAWQTLRETRQDRSRTGLHAQQILLDCLTARVTWHPSHPDSQRDDQLQALQELQARVLQLQQELLGNRHPSHLATLRQCVQHSQRCQIPLTHPLRKAIAEQLEMALGDCPTASRLPQADSVSSQEASTPELARLHWILDKIETLLEELDPTEKRPTRRVANPNLGCLRGSLAEVRAEAARNCAAGSCQDAFALLAQACSSCDELIARQVFALPSRAKWLKTLAVVEQLQADLLTILSATGFSDPVMRETALDLVLHRKGLTAEPMLTQRVAIQSGRYPELSKSLYRLDLLRSAIVQKTLSGPENGSSREDHEATLRQWHLHQANLEHILALLIPETNLEEQLRAVSSYRVSNQLPADTVLVEFVRYRPTDIVAPVGNSKARYLAFVLRQGVPANPLSPVDLSDGADRAQLEILPFQHGIAVVDLGDAADLDALIRSFRQTLAPRSPSPGRPLVLVPEQEQAAHRPGAALAEGEEPGVQLYQRLFLSLQPHLGENSRLLLAPDGDLALLPFEVLPAENGERLIDRYQISYVATGRNLLRFAQKAEGRAQPAVVAADPDFNLAEPDLNLTVPIPAKATREISSVHSRKQFAPVERLPGTADEGRRIAQRLGVEPLLGPKVTRGSLLGLSSPHILHLATHGFFLDPRNAPPNLHPD